MRDAKKLIRILERQNEVLSRRAAAYLGQASFWCCLGSCSRRTDRRQRLGDLDSAGVEVEVPAQLGALPGVLPGSGFVELPGFRKHVVVTGQAARLAA